MGVFATSFWPACRSVPLHFALDAAEEVEIRCWCNARRVLPALYWATVGRSRLIGSELPAKRQMPVSPTVQ